MLEVATRFWNYKWKKPKPVLQIAHTADMIGTGNLAARTNIVSRDEIGALAAAIDTMAANLNTITASRDELEREVVERKRAEAKREKILADLQDALADVKALSGLLPICAHCKKIRDDGGYWNQIEEYIKDHSEADFSHSVCPECMKKHFPDIGV